jgi:hypothetical protein
MPTTYTSLLGLALPVTGELSGTWGDTVNDYITQYLDASIAGALTVNADTTLTKTTGTSLGSTSSQYFTLIASGHSANITVTAPAASKTYMVINTSGTYTVKIRGAGPTTGVTLAANENAAVAWNGSDFVKIASSLVDGVTSVSVVSTNGLAGTSSGGATPALTLSTTVTGVVKGNGTAFSAATAGTDYLAPPSGTAILKANSGGALANATAGTDYVAPGTATTFTATQTFQGTSSTLSAVISDAAEPVTISATAATGTITYDTTTQSVLFYTTNATGNFTLNFRASSGTTLNALLSTGQAVTVVFLNTNGSTAYRNTSVQVDGTTSGVTTRWQGGSAPAAGNANSVDVYTYTIIKTGSATYSVFAAQTAFA